MGGLFGPIGKLHTTPLGAQRIKRNLQIETDDVVEWCGAILMDERAAFEKRGKNWYIQLDEIILTVNANSGTIITAHKIKG